MKKTALCLVLGLSVVAAACDGGQEAAAGTEPATQRLSWDAFRDEFIEQHFEYSPRTAVWAGRHEYDGRLDDISPEAVAELIAWLKAERAEAQDYAADELEGRSSFERSYLVAMIDQMLFYLEVSGFMETNPVGYAFGIDPSIYVTREYAPLETRMAAFATHTENIPAYLEQMRANLQPPLARPHREVSKNILGGMIEFYSDTVPDVFSEVANDALQERLAAASSSAIAAVNATIQWLDAQEVDDDFALGEEDFLTMLRMTEGVDITLDELIAAGEADLRANLDQLEEACVTFAPGASLSTCVVRADATKPQGGPVQGARGQLVELKQFLIDEDIVSIPGTEEALVDEAPPYQRVNFAYIMIPGPYEADLPSTYFIAPPDPSWSEEDQQAYLPGEKDLLYVSVHEVWPGHFLHFLHGKRSESVFGRLYYTYSTTEGWAHYAEQLMFDAGLDGGDPASHIGQLKNALLRDVRYLSAIGLHTGGMTVEDSREMFVEMAFQDYGNAIQQAQRGTYDPGYLNYTLGKLMIQKLREDWTATRGGRAAWKNFHDRFLSYGGPPIPMIRADMLGDDYQGDTRLLP
jgi:hypothetical protein